MDNMDDMITRAEHQEFVQRWHLPTDDITMKVDIFFAADKLTEDKYTELVGMLNAEA